MRLVYKLIWGSLLLLWGATNACAQVGGGSLPQFSIAYTITPGKTITLHGGSANAAAYQWFKNGVAIAGANQRQYTTGTAGLYTLVAYNENGCHSAESDGIQVIVNNMPLIPQPDTVVDLAVTIHSLNKNVHVGEGFEYEITITNNSPITSHQVVLRYPVSAMLKGLPHGKPASAGICVFDAATNSFIWSVPQIASGASVKVSMPVKVARAGPITSAVHVSGKELDPVMANNDATDAQQVAGLKVPNVFTPNGDGLNDTFVITGLEQYTDNEMVVINRWGNHVYEKKNYQNDWAGQGLPDGTYYYVLTARNPQGDMETYKGYITLLRKRM